LVARMPPPRPQRAVGAQFDLNLIIREIISHLWRELLLNFIVLPEFRSYGADGRRPLIQVTTQSNRKTGLYYYEPHSPDMLIPLVLLCSIDFKISNRNVIIFDLKLKNYISDSEVNTPPKYINTEHMRKTFQINTDGEIQEKI